MMFGKREKAISRILIVEDEPLIAFDTEHYLREQGYRIVGTVDNAAEAIALLEKAPPDLVLADVQLSSGDDGLAVARAAFGRDVPVLLVTGYCPPEARSFAIGCLAKPYSHRILRDALLAVEARRAGTTPRRLPPGLTLYDEGAPA